MEYQFFSITLRNDTVEIKIHPIEFFNVDFSVRYVVMYKLSLIHKEDPLKNHESIIPYYISNGQTNRLRANILYPFMCYSDWSNQGICPFFADKTTKQTNRGRCSLLLKYQVGPNYAYSKLENIVIENFIGKDGLEQEDKRRLEYNQMEKASDKLSRGLPSVLPRLRNFLDFVMCIMNENIIHFNPEVDDIRCFRPLVDRNDHFYVNMKKCEHLPETLTPEDDYRFVLISILSRYVNLILKNHFFDDIQLVKMTTTPISKEDFNLHVNKCDKDASIKNTTSYGIISSEFKNIFKTKIDRAVVHIKRTNMSQEDTDMLFLASILPFQFKINPFFLYSDMLTHYKMDCSKPTQEDDDQGGLCRSEL